MSLNPNTITPLCSSLLEQEPELSDLIKKYVNKYPEMIDDLKLAYKEKAFEELDHRLHDLKSTGGNYGFMVITELAIKAKNFLKNGDIEAVSAMLTELENLHIRMNSGLSE